MKSLLAAFAAALVFSATVGSASAECKCRAPGFIAHHGEIACLKTAAGPRLARCGMVLNNSAWIFLPDSCPLASSTSADEVAMSLAPTSPHLCTGA
jgi:hypothetical protein